MQDRSEAHNPISPAAQAALNDVVSRANASKTRRELLEVERAEAAERGSLFGHWTTLAGLVVLLGAVIVWNNYALKDPPAPAPPEILEATARMNLAIIAQEIEAYTEATGSPPTSLEEFGFDDEHVRLRRNGGSVELVSTEVLPEIVYRVGTDPALVLASNAGVR